jgi:SAM-dependent methyltransferase
LSKRINSGGPQIKDHYEQWPFPGTDFFSREGLLLLRYLGRWTKQEKFGEYGQLRVIDVGCGTGHTTIALAKNFPNVSFLGIDKSQTAIQSACLRAEKEKLSNTTFQVFDLREDLPLPGEFEIVLCLGVLHHIKDSERASKKIARLVKPKGYLVLWLYGRLGRFQHNMNQEFLRLLTKKAERGESIEVARSFLEELGSRFAAGSGFYTPKGSNQEGLTWLLNHSPWLADQMIPAFERGVTIQDVLRLFKENRLEFWRWLGVPLHIKKYTTSERLLKCFERLSPQEKLIAIDYLIKPSYYFVVGKKGGQN